MYTYVWVLNFVSLVSISVFVLVFITMAPKYSLSSEIVILLALFFGSRLPWLSGVFVVSLILGQFTISRHSLVEPLKSLMYSITCSTNRDSLCPFDFLLLHCCSSQYFKHNILVCQALGNCGFQASSSSLSSLFQVDFFLSA